MFVIFSPRMNLAKSAFTTIVKEEVGARSDIGAKAKEEVSNSPPTTYRGCSREVWA